MVGVSAMKNAKKGNKKLTSIRMNVPVSEAESDRRLRPVLDALYSHNSKQALKYSQQALQRRPGWPAARALRACALLQSEHWAEAEAEIAEVRADLDAGRVPLDEDCARKLHMYYMEVRREDIAAGIYEQAWKADQTQFQLAEIAFCLYIRGSAFSTAKKLATKLHRIASSQTSKYAMWATAALWLETTCKLRYEVTAETLTSDKQMLKLAGAMLSAALHGSPTPSAEMVRFSLRVLQDGGELDKAHKLISNPRLVIDDAEKLQLRSDLKYGNISVQKDLRTLLSEHDADDWVNWMKFFQCYEQEDSWKSRVSEFVTELIAIEVTSSRPKRGPFLAQLELLCRSEEYDSLAEAVVQYFGRFGSKTVCAHDLRPYLSVIRKTEEYEETLSNLFALVTSDTDTSHLTLSWIRLWHGRLDESVEDLFQRYNGFLTDKADKTERQIGDDYLLLIAHKLLPDTCETSCNRYADAWQILLAIIVLEVGLTRSPSNFHIKLLLMRLYQEVGATQRIAELWQSLEIKHLLVPTLIHLVLQPAFNMGHHDFSQDLLESVECLWRECDREVPECTSKAFRAGSINAAVEFVLFRQRLEGSVELAQVMTSEIVYNLVVTGGEGIGVQRAFDCITSMPRFTFETAQAPRILITNEDRECLRFWEVSESEKQIHMQIPDAIKEEKGLQCSLSQQETVTADLVSLELLMRITLKDFGSERTGRSLEAARSTLTRLLTAKELSELPKTTVLRMRIASNLLDTSQMLQSSQSIPTGVVSQPILSQANEVLEAAQSTTQMLLEMAQSIVGCKNESHPSKISVEQDAVDGANGRANETNCSVKQLQKCGKVVFDILLVTCTALSSFGPELRVGRRRAKKSASKASVFKDGTISNHFNCVRQIVVLYQKAIVSASSWIQTWLASCTGQGLQFVRSDRDPPLHETLSFLQRSLPYLDLTEGSVELGSEVELHEFCETVMTQIRDSHATTCQAILETLTKIVSRMKLTDF